MQLTPQNASDIITRSLVKIQNNHPFFSYILMYFKVSAKTDDRISTAGVDKMGNFIYDEKFILSLTAPEVHGLLVHEALHIAKGDFFRIGKRDSTIWNIASDAIINFILKQENFVLPKCAINPDQYGAVTIASKKYNVKGKTTEEFYDELITDAENIENQLSGNNGHGGFDTHLENNCDTNQSTAQENKWKSITVEAATSARARGNLPGCAESIVNTILNPTIDWRSLIQRFITNEIPIDFTNRIPSRRFYGTGIWTPSTLREKLDVFIGVDVSGSTSDDREYFMSEVMGILCSYEQVNARLIFWDYQVCEENDHLITRDNKDSLINMAIANCNGGTRFSCYTEYLKEKNYRSKVNIIFTDGEIESKPEVPEGTNIFVLTKKGIDNIVKNYGIVCRITDIDE